MTENKYQISDDDLVQIYSNVSEMISIRQVYDCQNQEIVKYFSPLYLDFQSGQMNTAITKSNLIVYTDTDDRANSVIFSYVDNFVVFILDLLVSPHRKWFEIKLSLLGNYGNISIETLRENTQVKSYLKYSQEYLLEYFEEISVYKYFGLALYDAVMYGYGCLLLDIVDGFPMLKYVPPNECYYDLDTYGNINVLMRRFKLSGKQIADAFPDETAEFFSSGIDNVDLKSLNNQYTMVQFIQKNYFGKGKHLNLYYFEDTSSDSKSNKTVVLKEEMITYDNFFVFRWKQRGGFTYSYGQTVEVLEEIKNLNKISQCDRAMMLDRFFPTWTVDDKLFKNFDPQFLNGGYVVELSTMASFARQTSTLVNRLTPELNIQPPMIDYQRIIEIINRVFYAELIQLRGGTKTATEVIRLNADMVKSLQPIISQIYCETISPFLSTFLNILIKKKKLQPIEEFNLSKIKFGFTSQVALAQKVDDNNNYAQMLMALAQTSQVSQNEYYVASLEEEQTLEKIKDLFDADRGIFKDHDDIIKYLNNKNQAMQERAQLENAKIGSETTKNIVDSGIKMQEG